MPAMNNDERDIKISETHDAVIVMVKQVKDHNEALFGNGRPGLVNDMVLVKERQDQCPARRANTIQGKRLGIAYVLMIIGIIGIIVTIIGLVLK